MKTEKVYSTKESIIERAKKEGAIVLERNENCDKNIIDTLDINHINTQIINLRGYVINNPDRTLNETIEANNYIYENYPTIFKVINRGDDIDTIKDMIENIKIIKEGQKTFEQVSTEFGKKLYKEYGKK